MTFPWHEPKLHIFDLDDTLVHTRSAVREAWEPALKVLCSRLGCDLDRTRTLLKVLVGEFGSTAYRQYWHALVSELVSHLPNSAVSSDVDSITEEVRLIYDKRFWQNLRLFDGSVDYLNRLVDSGRTVGIASNGDSDFQWRKIRHLGLDKWFDPNSVRTEGSQAVQRQKPNAFMLLGFLDQHALDPQNCFFYGNSPVDIIAGNLAGVRTVAVGSIANQNRLKLLVPDAILRDFTQIPLFE